MPSRDPSPAGNRRPRRRLLYVAVGLAVLAAATLTVISLTAPRANGAAGQPPAEAEAGDETPEKAPVPVEVAAVASGEISSYISATANLVAEHQVTALAEIEGRIARLLVDEGDRVRRGQQLAVLVRDDQEILLRKAELREASATAAYRRGEDLIAKELISREEFDRLTIDYEIARQELAEAQWGLDKTVIRAPFDGRVTAREVQVGQHLRPGDELFEITDFDPLIARIFLPERDILGLEAGRDVRIALNADASIRFGGRIRQISPVVDTATGTVKVTVEAADPPPAVRPGSFVSIHIVRQTRGDAVLVPREAVLRELKQAHVFVATAAGAEKRQVELGLEEGAVVEALSGVTPGERVIVAGQGGLKDGSPIKVLDAGAPSAG